MSELADYAVPGGILALSGPVSRPEPGTLALRGDLAHIALASRYLVAHYIVPFVRQIGAADAALKLRPEQGADAFAHVAAGSRFEVLDMAGDWCWGCVGPDGPSGYLRKDALAPEAA